MNSSRSLIAPSSNPLLERALQEKLNRRAETAGRLGELEPLAVRLGLMQNTLKPRLMDPQLVVCAADHGLVVDGVGEPTAGTTDAQVAQLLGGHWPLAVFARAQRIQLSVVDCGTSAELAGHDRLLRRKIAHGTRNARVGPAMSLDQAHAAMRAGMEIAETLDGNALLCAGLGLGANESAALVLSRLTDVPVHEFLPEPLLAQPERLQKHLAVLQAALARHRTATDPIEVLAALGGYEVAVLVGVMLVGASKRRLLLVDGLPACAALMLASRIATPVTDYCVFCRSHPHRGLDRALALFRASALLELGLDAADGTGATLAWPLVNNAAALLTDVPEGEEAGPTRPVGLGPRGDGVAAAEDPA